ncbi:hypothetical protein RB195_019652 [Necator americanus]|uniref:Ig-like domain-containing protein n=1 Tax=Necator americanus TaxID=51031 RepID=A0ABR1CHQ3_NECAM
MGRRPLRVYQKDAGDLWKWRRNVILRVCVVNYVDVGIFIVSSVFSGLKRGHKVFLSCASPAEDATAALWERVDGEMPTGASTSRGVLRIPPISRDDEGKYQCTTTKNGVDVVSVVELHVDDFIPVFHGQEALTYSPLSDEDMKNLDIVLTFNATGEDAKERERKQKKKNKLGENDSTLQGIS